MKWTPWHMWLYWILIRIIWLGSKLVTWDLLFWDFWWVFVMVSRYHHSALRGIYERNEPFFLLFQVFQELVAPPLRCNHDNMMCRGTKYHPLTMTKLLFSMDLLFFWCLAPFVGFPFGMIEGAISPTSCLGHFNTCDPFSLLAHCLIIHSSQSTPLPISHFTPTKTLNLFGELERRIWFNLWGDFIQNGTLVFWMRMGPSGCGLVSGFMKIIVWQWWWTYSMLYSQYQTRPLWGFPNSHIMIRLLICPTPLFFLCTFLKRSHRAIYFDFLQMYLNNISCFFPFPTAHPSSALYKKRYFQTSISLIVMNFIYDINIWLIKSLEWKFCIS